MNDRNKLLSYCTLLLFGLKNLYNKLQKSEEYDNYPDVKEMIANVIEYYKTEGWPDIYDFLEKPDIIVESTLPLIQAVSMSKIIDGMTIFHLFNGYYDVDLDIDHMDIFDSIASCNR